MRAWMLLAGALMMTASMPAWASNAPEPAMAAGHAPEAHGADTGHEHGDHGHSGPPGEINWFKGFLGTSDEREPGLLWRPSSMPPPFAATIINFGVFAYILVRYGKKPLQEALTTRKKAIMRDIEAARQMKDDAAKRLALYEERLQHIDDEIERIRKEFREQGERERERIICDAEEKRDRMIKDAEFLIEQEAKQMRIDLRHETVHAAVAAAQQMLETRVSADDHDRLAKDYLGALAQAKGLGVTKGGQA